MEAKKIVLGILIGMYGALLAIIYSTNLIPEGNRLIWQDISYLVGPVFAFCAAIYAFGKYGRKSIHGKSLQYIALGMAMFLIAELLWVYYEIILGETPSPSAADIFFLAVYPFLLYGIFNELKLGKISWTKKKVLTSAIILLALWPATYYFSIYLPYDSQLTFYENLVTVGYGVGDMVIVTALVILLNLSAEFWGGMLSKSWNIFAIGMLSRWLGDIAYAIYYGQYIAGELLYRQIDYLWMVNYFLMGYALLMQGSAMEKLKSSILSMGKSLPATALLPANAIKDSKKKRL